MNHATKRTIEQIPCFIEWDSDGLSHYSIIIKKEGQEDVRIPITCWCHDDWSKAFAAYDKVVKGGNIGKVEQIEKNCSICGLDNHDGEDHKRLWGDKK